MGKITKECGSVDEALALSLLEKKMSTSKRFRQHISDFEFMKADDPNKSESYLLDLLDTAIQMDQAKLNDKNISEQLKNTGGLPAAPGVPKGGQKGKGKSKQKNTLYQFPKGSATAPETNKCYYWNFGNCNRANCPFLHEQANGTEKASLQSMMNKSTSKGRSASRGGKSDASNWSSKSKGKGYGQSKGKWNEGKGKWGDGKGKWQSDKGQSKGQAKGKGKSKGKGSKSRDRTPSREPYRPNPKSPPTPIPKAMAAKTGICYAFQNGACTRGKECHAAHIDPVQAAKIMGKAKSNAKAKPKAKAKEQAAAEASAA